jgi:hypothetical protein
MGGPWAEAPASRRAVDVQTRQGRRRDMACSGPWSSSRGGPAGPRIDGAGLPCQHCMWQRGVLCSALRRAAPPAGYGRAAPLPLATTACSVLQQHLRCGMCPMLKLSILGDTTTGFRRTVPAALHTHACCDSNGQEIHYTVPIIRGPANAPLRLREVRTAHCPGNRPALVRVPGDGLGLRLESARTCEAVYIDTATCPSTRSGNMQLL